MSGATLFRSLDYLYVPAADVDASAARWAGLGAELVWKIRAFGTVVACLHVGGDGPELLLSGHLTGAAPILVYRVDDYRSAVAALRGAGIDLHEIEIPPGPCATFAGPAGERLAVYERTRPEVAERFAGRVDE
jgi:hypothetical protein